MSLESHESQLSNDAKIVQNGVHHAEIGMRFGKVYISAKDRNSRRMWVVYSIHAVFQRLFLMFGGADGAKVRVRGDSSNDRSGFAPPPLVQRAAPAPPMAEDDAGPVSAVPGVEKC